MERVSETIADVFEHALAGGTIIEAGQAAAEQEAVVHFDETGTQPEKQD